MPTPPSLRELLQQTELHQIYGQSGRSLVTVTTKTSLDKTLHLLTSNTLHSIPVRDVEHNSWPAFVTIHQLLVYALSLTYKVSTDPNTSGSVPQSASSPRRVPQSPRTIANRSSLSEWLQEVYNLQKISELFKKTMVGEVLGFTEKINAVASTISLWDALIVLTQPPLHLHRLVTFNKIGQMEAVISQSSLLQFISEHIESLPLSIGTRRLEDVGLVRTNFYFLKFNAKLPVIESFWKMYTEGLDCGAVVDDDGKLVGNLSTSDLSSVAAMDFNTLKHETYDYICQYGRKRNLKTRDYFYDLIGEDLNQHQRAEDKLRLVPPVAILPTATIENALLKMYVAGIHKLWIVNEEQKPVSLVSLTDLLRFMKQALDE